MLTMPALTDLMLTEMGDFFSRFDVMSDAEFERLPLIVEGESKIVRRTPGGLALIKLKPTIYSFTANRAAVVPGSDLLRLRATRTLVAELQKNHCPHTYLHVGERFILSTIVVNPPPIEVIVKGFHSGTSKHRYRGMSGMALRESHPFYDTPIEDDGAYPQALVRFDWRNPLRDATGKALADEVLGDDTADLFIDTKMARPIAMRAFRVLSNFLAARDIVLYDLCLFITEDGTTNFGEVSQDCGRFRHFELGSLDKDVWRAGGSSADVLAKWQLLNDAIER